VRLPVITSYFLTVHAVFAKEPSRKQAQNISQDAAGVKLADVAGTVSTLAERIRKRIDDPMALDLFVCGDNVRKCRAP
jgi:aspartate-semialdehyde dehydrogenase